MLHPKVLRTEKQRKETDQRECFHSLESRMNTDQHVYKRKARLPWCIQKRAGMIDGFSRQSFVRNMHVTCSDDLCCASEFLLLVGRMKKCVKKCRFPVIHFSHNTKHRASLAFLPFNLKSKPNRTLFCRRIWNQLRIDLYTAALLLASNQIGFCNRIGYDNIPFI